MTEKEITTMDENTQPELIPTPSAELPIKKRRGKKPKYDVSNPRPGRPTRSLKKKVGQPFRFLITKDMKDRLDKWAADFKIKVSGEGRLMLYLFLIITGQMEKSLLTDGTFEEMRAELSGSPELGDLVRKYQGKELVDALYAHFNSES